MISKTVEEKQAMSPASAKGVMYEIPDFLFATDTITKIAKGKGTWGDAAIVGITAAAFFIPPAKLAQLSAKALNIARVAAVKTTTNEVTSVAAKRAAQRTINNIDDMRGPIKRTSDKPGARSRYDDEPYDGNLNVDDRLTIRRQPGETPTQPFTADQPNMLTSKLTDDINKLYKLKKNMKEVDFNARRAQILLQLFPEKELLPDVTDIARGSNEFMKSSAGITNLKKKQIIRNLKRSDNPNNLRLAKELEDLDFKTLKQEVDIRPGKRKKDPQIITTKEKFYETTAARSAIQPELDDVLYQKELAEGMLKEASSPVGPIDSSVIQKLTSEVQRLDRQAIRLQDAINNPYSITAINQTKNIIPSSRPGRSSTEYLSPRSYTARESVKRSGKAPDSPKRSTLSELKSDEETILKQLKTTEPSQHKTLQADLKRTRKEIMNVEVGRLRQSLDDQVKNIPAAAKSVKDLTLKELESELIRLRKGYKKLSKFKGKEAEAAMEQVATRGKAVKELLDKAKTRSGKPVSDMVDMQFKTKGSN